MPHNFFPLLEELRSYDPSFGDDALNFLPGDPQLLRANLLRYNALLKVRPWQHQQHWLF